MKLLLDTHALLWWFLDHPRLGTAARELISDRQNDIFVSPVSVWEIGWKVRQGKLSEAVSLNDELLATLQSSGFEALPITSQHMFKAVAFPSSHKDPFDRTLAAQCILEDMVLISMDAQMAGLGVALCW